MKWICLIIPGAVIGQGCATKQTAKFEEVSRISNRDGLEAVLGRQNLHATVAWQYELHIKREQDKISDASLVLEGSKFEPELTVKWNGPRQLTIIYQKARISHFENVIWIRKGEELEEVEVVLQKGK